ncbi:hypothetical protein ACFSR6_20720 [Pedobacter vanadiisoli]|uniref:Uncharacterized protein n=1 Tax=Pedobacter vanadiisoli TaxID=1761975 RepID=A0ABW5MRV6_9SPHI
MKSTFKPIQQQKSNFWKYIVALLFFISVLHNFFGAITYNTFVIIDNILSASGANSPILMWLFIGCFIGIGIGSVIACRKFKLNPRISLLAVVPAAITLTLFSANTGPLYAIHPKTEFQAETDTSTIDSLAITSTTVIVPKKKLKPLKKTKKELQVSTCIDQNTQVSVTVRSDSVKLFFRIAKIKDGEWSDWESIFIPQPGQYALSGKRGKIIANSIQYYYEVKQESTRSPSNPFTKSLCLGPLHIDTY